MEKKKLKFSKKNVSNFSIPRESVRIDLSFFYSKMGQCPFPSLADIYRPLLNIATDTDQLDGNFYFSC